MVTEDQSAVIRFLASPATHGVPAVDRLETHTAIVFLAGSLAYKLKRAVRFDYLDFSTVERRRVCCEAEARLNQRTAPALYRRVVPVTREPGGVLALGGDGSPIDWLVEMNRFREDDLFDRLAASGRLALEWMPGLAEAIAAFHLAAERRLDHGGRAGMAWVIDGNAAGFAEFGGACDPAVARRVTDASRGMLDGHAALLEARRTAGYVRQCHGDLHLRNIVLLDGRPTLFDGVEFNDDIACIDVLYDVAFLLMDLWRRRLPRHANVIWNEYIAVTGDTGGIPLLPLFLSCRAAVRAKTSATAAMLQADAARREELTALAREYLSMAELLLNPPGPRLIAVGGFSGSGKSTLARALAPDVGGVPGALVIRSDEIRKRLCGVSPLERLGPDSYRPHVSAQVYARLAGRARDVVGAGHSAIVDAVFQRPSDREAIEHVAVQASVPFTGLWLEAEEPTLIARVAGRRADPSDADADVVRTQWAGGAGSVTWRCLDSSRPADEVRRHAADAVAGTRSSPLKMP
jgi:aminoglycoside phosphotransferase family enzyme/predicted kinase